MLTVEVDMFMTDSLGKKSPVMFEIKPDLILRIDLIGDVHANTCTLDLPYDFAYFVPLINLACRFPFSEILLLDLSLDLSET